MISVVSTTFLNIKYTNLCNIFISHQDCRCENFINAGGWGNCIKEENDKALCYVKDPSSSTCNDLQDSVSDIGKKWSYEACSKGSMIDTIASKVTHNHLMFTKCFQNLKQKLSLNDVSRL